MTFARLHPSLRSFIKQRAEPMAVLIQRRRLDRGLR
jgi:hypothetical protein